MKIDDKLLEYGLKEKEAKALADVLKTNDRAMEGDALSKLKIRKIKNDNEALGGLATLIDDSELNWNKDDIISSVSLMSTLDNIMNKLDGHKND